jgi:hypothetical protein
MNDKLFLFDDLITELSEDASPGHLDQLELFYKDTEELFGSMTSIITSSQLAVTCSSLHPELAQPLAAGEPAGHLLQWPSPRCGLTSVIRSDQQGQCNSLIAVFWLLRTLIARTSSGEEIEIDLLLTGKTLGKNSLPQAGDCINALIWLQGHLWGPTES